MKTLAIINLKGGTGKTVTASNMAHILAVIHNKKVLLVDGDKQGNASRYFRVYGEHDGTAALLRADAPDAESMEGIIYRTAYKGLDIITSNMDLYTTDRELYEDSADVSGKLAAALKYVQDDYEFCIIDNGPAVDMVTLNVLAAADDVLIPIRPDEFSFSGLLDLVEQINAVQESVNPSLTIQGAFFTHWQNREAFIQARQSLEASGICHVLQTAINYNPKVPESTLEEKPLCAFSPRSWAAIQYKRLTAEYLNLTDSDKKKEG